MTPRDELQEQLKALRKGYARQLPEKMGGIESAYEAFAGQPWSEGTCMTAYRMVHSLAGSSGTYGFSELGQVARSLESILKACLEGRAPLDEAQRARARELLGRLNQMALEAAQKA